MLQQVPAGGEAAGLSLGLALGTLKRSQEARLLLVCACPLAAGPGAAAGRGSAAAYQLGYFHNGCLRLGVGEWRRGGDRGAATAALTLNWDLLSQRSGAWSWG